MTPGELKQVIEVLKGSGVTHFKDGALELTFQPTPISNVVIQAQTPVDKPATESNPIEHKVEQLSSLMKLKDMDLVDALFPDHTQEDSA